MSFLANNKRFLNVAIIVSCLVDIAIGFLINILSQSPFTLWKKEDIIILGILAVLTLILIVCNVIINIHNNSVRPKKLQKAFQQSGGYDVAAEEMSNCIKSGNLKKCKNIKKILKEIER